MYVALSASHYNEILWVLAKINEGLKAPQSP